jgi:hypothetical protein
MEIHTCHRSIDRDLALFDEEKKKEKDIERKTRINNQQHSVTYTLFLLNTSTDSGNEANKTSFIIFISDISNFCTND